MPLKGSLGLCDYAYPLENVGICGALCIEDLVMLEDHVLQGEGLPFGFIISFELGLFLSLGIVLPGPARSSIECTLYGQSPR